MIESISSELLHINTITPDDVILLSKEGITRLRDIADLDRWQIPVITQKLGLLEGRIEFEYWIEQARDCLDTIKH